MEALAAEADQDPTPGEGLDPGHVQHAGQGPNHAQGPVHDPGEVQEAGLAPEAGGIQDPGADPLPEDQDPNLQQDQDPEARKRDRDLEARERDRDLEARERDLGPEAQRKREAKAEAGRDHLPKKTEMHHQNKANRKKAKKNPCQEAHLPGSNLQE